MPEIKIIAVTDGENWQILKPDADTDRFLPETIHTYTFKRDVKRSGLTTAKARDRISEFDLTANADGSFNPEAYAIVRSIADVSTFCSGYTHVNAGTSEEIPLTGRTLQWIDENLPEEVVSAYMSRANPPVKAAAVLKPDPPKDSEKPPTSEETIA